MTTSDLTTTGQKQLTVEDSSSQVFALLKAAVDQGTSPEALERLVALQERILAKNAESEFVSAMGEFQSRCPPIPKKSIVKGRNGVKLYAYSALPDIVAAVRQLLLEVGLSYSFNTQPDGNGGVKVECILRHRAGHSQTTSIYVPATQGQNTNPAQNTGIQVQYGMRYAFIGALGITTADEDRDGVAQKQHPISDKQAADLKAMIDEAGADQSRFLAYMGVAELEEIQEKEYSRAVSALEAKRRRS